MKAKNANGITVDEDISDKFDVNAEILDGQYAGKTIAYCLASHEGGRELLSQDAALRKRITEQGLNALVRSGSDSGKSALYCLVCSQDGRDILLSDPSLVKQINEHGLNNVIATGDCAGESVCSGY